MMNTKKSQTAKMIQMRPKSKGSPMALESILLGLEMIENELANHFDQETKIEKQ